MECYKEARYDVISPDEENFRMSFREKIIDDLSLQGLVSFARHKTRDKTVWEEEIILTSGHQMTMEVLSHGLTCRIDYSPLYGLRFKSLRNLLKNFKILSWSIPCIFESRVPDKIMSLE